MNARTLLITFVLIAVVMVVVAGDPNKKLSMEEAYEIQSGIWANEEYSEIMITYKFIVHPDGTYIGFPSMSSADFTNTGRLTILDTMIDSDGNIWIKATNDIKTSYRKYTAYEIQKHSNSNMIMEIFDSEIEGWWGEGFPAYLKPKDHLKYMYRIYYRQE